MADEKDTIIANLQARIEALEELAVAIPATAGQAIAPTKKKAVQLSGETFSVDGKKYQAVYPKWKDGENTVTEENLLADKNLQKALVSSGSKLVRLAGMFLVFLFAFSFNAQAISITINPYSVELITPTKREVYPLQEMLIIFRASNDAFEVQSAETRSKIWGGDIDSVTISGHTTDSMKIIFLRSLMLETTTTGGYRVFIGRENLEYFYNTVSNRLDLKYGRNKQPLWFGSADSLMSGPSGSAAKIAYLRLLNRYRTSDWLPTTSVATIAAGAAAGSSPTVSVTGDAYSGSISVTTGTTATTGTLATVTLKIRATTGTRISLDPTNANACLHSVRWHGSGTTTTLVITIPTTALSDATAYTWNYTVTPF
jgi:hypothetical protein